MTGAVWSIPGTFVSLSGVACISIGKTIYTMKMVPGTYVTIIMCFDSKMDSGVRAYYDVHTVVFVSVHLIARTMGELTPSHA